ncbi:Cysteine protease atg4 [Leucoagaricus gongylophorus]
MSLSSSSSSSSSSKRGVSERLTGWLSQTLSSGRRSALIMVAQQQGRMRYLVDQEQRGSEAMWLLGVDHRNEPECFYLDFVSRIWLTYRSHLAHPITTTTTTTTTDDDHRSRWQWTPQKSWSSDAGWGCMLRTGQSLLANALVHARLSRDWRRPPCPLSSPNYATYVQILTWFFDSPQAPFSVHRMALAGKHFGTQVGQWFGPSVAAGALQRLVDAFPHAALGIALAKDSVISQSDVFLASHSHPHHPLSTTTTTTTWGDRPVLLLIGLRLGIDGVNPIYYETIKFLFTFPQCIGIAGGRPSSSYYFVGSQADNLFYLDPHHPRPAIPLRSPPSTPAQDHPSLTPLQQHLVSAYSDAELKTYHCDKVRKMPLRGLDPSMLLGFLCKTSQEWDDLRNRVEHLPRSIFSIQDEHPTWAQDGDDESMMGLESISDPEEEDDEEEEERPSGSESDIEQGWVDSGVQDKGLETPLAGSTIVVGRKSVVSTSSMISLKEEYDTSNKNKKRRRQSQVVVPSSASSCSSPQPMFCSLSSSSSSSSSSSCSQRQQEEGEGEGYYLFPFPGSPDVSATGVEGAEDEDGEFGIPTTTTATRGRRYDSQVGGGGGGGGRRRMFMGKAKDGGRTRSGGVKGIGIFLKEG